MRVAAVQYRARKGDVEGSRRRLVALAERAAPGVDLLVLPEMAVTGYVFPDRAAVAAVAERPDGPTFRAVSSVARRHHCWAVAGFPEAAGDALYNSAMVVDPSGSLAFVYRKTLLYDEDVHWATPGDSGYRTFTTEAGRFTVGICMDLNDTAFCAWVDREDVDAVAFPTNWVESDTDIDLFTYWAWRMGRSRAALVAANTWGREAHVRFSGCSAVLERRVLLAHLPATGDGFLRADLHPTVKDA